MGYNTYIHILWVSMGHGPFVSQLFSISSCCRSWVTHPGVGTLAFHGASPRVAFRRPRSNPPWSKFKETQRPDPDLRPAERHASFARSFARSCGVRGAPSRQSPGFVFGSLRSADSQLNMSTSSTTSQLNISRNVWGFSTNSDGFLTVALLEFTSSPSSTSSTFSDDLRDPGQTSLLRRKKLSSEGLVKSKQFLPSTATRSVRRPAPRAPSQFVCGKSSETPASPLLPPHSGAFPPK